MIYFLYMLLCLHSIPLLSQNSLGLVDAKRLVLFAGPHRSGATSVEEFFQKYCHGWIKNDKDGFALRFWRWPDVPMDNVKAGVPKHKVFQNLVLEPSENDPANKDIMKAIVDAWDDVQDGIIVGTEYFDQIGPYAEYDGLAAMKRVVGAVKADKVTVVVNYRAPRFDHWESVWKGSVEGTDRSYKEFMCHPQQYHEKIELLATAANPLQIALSSQQQGWDVAIMDMEGIDQENKDVSHTIACNVMDAKCSEADGWVNHHTDETIHNNEAEDGHELVELSDKQKELAEELLQYRDCAYQPVMEQLKKKGTANFEVHNQYSLWKHCDSSKDYQNLLDVDLVFRGLLSQLNCEKVLYDKMPKNAEDVLSGAFTLDASEKGHSRSKKKHHYFLWLLLLGGAYVGVSMYLNGNRVPDSWKRLAARAHGVVRNMERGTHRPIGVSSPSSPEAELESMDFTPTKTALSGEMI